MGCELAIFAVCFRNLGSRIVFHQEQFRAQSEPILKRDRVVRSSSCRRGWSARLSSDAPLPRKLWVAAGSLRSDAHLDAEAGRTRARRRIACAPTSSDICHIDADISLQS